MSNRFTAEVRQLATAVLIAGMGLVGNAAATPVTVTGTFTSFTSDMAVPPIPPVDPVPPPPVVNGVSLTPSGSSGSSFRYLTSNPVIFSNPTTRLDFIRNPPGTSGVWPTNALEFIPNAGPSDVEPGQTFTLGTFRYTNGQWFPRADIAFSLTTHSADAGLNGVTFSGTMRLVSTSVADEAPFNPYDEADFFYLLDNPSLGSSRVFEAANFHPSLQPSGNPGNTGDFALTGYIGSLVPNGFVPLNAAGFTTPSIVGGPVDLSTIHPPIPEPETYAMMLAGLGLLGFFARRRRQNQRPA